MPSLQRQLENAILEMESLEIFSIYDFLPYGNYEAVKKALLRLEKNGEIEHIIKGLYFKKDLNSSYPEEEKIALSIAKKNAWTISPTGEECLSLLSLRECPYDKNTYLSTGPNAEYNINGITIRFKHVNERDLINMSLEARIAVQAIKAIGRRMITKDDYRKIGAFLSRYNRNRIREEAGGCTKWVYAVILTILQDYTRKVKQPTGCFLF